MKTRENIVPVQDGRGGWHFRSTENALAAEPLDAVLTRHRVNAIAPTLTFAGADAAMRASHGLNRWYSVYVDEGVDPIAVAAELKAFELWFEFAQPDAIGSLADLEPNDPDFGLQYGLKNTGQPIADQNGVPGADVEAPAAWDVTTGTDDVVIALLDAGVNEHDDLTGALVPGWNIIEDGSDTAAICNSHGMHVAGIAAARGNNGIGIAGMNWHAKIMPVVIVADNCFGTATDAADGVIWATDNGADIISMSLQYYADVDLLHDAVLYARSLGVIVIAAAGNNNIVVAWPGRFAETICVAATNNLDTHAGFSNSGPELTIAAAGDDVYSTTNTSTYGYKSGTSMATPLVSGLAALMRAVDPTVTHDEIADILISTAEDVDVQGFDNNTGYGRVNAHQALDSTVIWRADADDDGDVDVSDLLRVLADWGPCVSEPPACAGDINFDDVVNVFDLLAVLAAWGYDG